MKRLAVIVWTLLLLAPALVWANDGPVSPGLPTGAPTPLAQNALKSLCGLYRGSDTQGNEFGDQWQLHRERLTPERYAQIRAEAWRLFNERHYWERGSCEDCKLAEMPAHLQARGNRLRASRREPGTSYTIRNAELRENAAAVS